MVSHLVSFHAAHFTFLSSVSKKGSSRRSMSSMRPTATPPSLPRTPDIDSEAASSHLSAGSAGSLHDIGRVRHIFTSHSKMHFYQTGNKPIFVNTFLLVHGLFNLLMLVNFDCKNIICIKINFECVFRIWG
jgi:hypothetical protein